MDKQKLMKKFIVTTTINPPTDALLKYAKLFRKPGLSYKLGQSKLKRKSKITRGFFDNAQCA